MDTIKEKICVNKLVATQREIILVEGDMIIPDSKPDILNTICTSGVICLDKKEVMNGKVRIDGKINTHIMYLSESDQDRIRSINTILEFSESIQINNCEEEMDLDIQMKIKSIECKVINGRKVGVKATVEMDINVYSNEEMNIITQINESDDVQFLKKKIKTNSMIGIGETKINTKDTIMIDNVDNLAEILKLDLEILNKDIKISYNKVLTKAEAEVKILYLTEDNRIKNIVSKIPIVGFIDIENVTEGNICNSIYEVKNIFVRPNSSEDHSMYLEIEVDVKILAYEDKELDFIEDLYSPCNNLEFSKKRLSTIMEKQSVNDIKQIREKVIVEGIMDKQILDVEIKPIIEKEIKRNNKIIYDINLEMKFILIDNQKMIDIQNIYLPFEYVIDNINSAEDKNINLMIETKNADYIMHDGEFVTANVDLGMSTDIFKVAELNMMDEIKVNGERDIEDYNIIIYIVKDGDTLWEIAKKFGSTINDIMIVNGIEDVDKITKGQKLFIPKYNRNKSSIFNSKNLNYA